jgi:glycerol-3-phosphate acyltransferase PlsY
MTLLVSVAVIIAAYLLGAIPFGLVLVRLKTGRDVRQSGSGNIGATNVLRTTGKVWGIVTLVLDASKGAGAVLLARALLPGDATIAWLAGTAAVIGHCFPLYLRFHGGKGVATCLGVFLVLSPLALLPALGVFVLAALVSRTVSVGSISAALAFPLAAWWFDRPPAAALTAVLVCSLTVIFKHRSNIVRIVQGREHRLW